METLLRVVAEHDEVVISRPILVELLGVTAHSSPVTPRNSPVWRSIVTGDKALLALKEYRGVRVLSLAHYLKSEFGL